MRFRYQELLQEPGTRNQDNGYKFLLIYTKRLQPVLSMPKSRSQSQCPRNASYPRTQCPSHNDMHQVYTRESKLRFKPSSKFHHVRVNRVSHMSRATTITHACAHAGAGASSRGAPPAGGASCPCPECRRCRSRTSRTGAAGPASARRRRARTLLVTVRGDVSECFESCI